MIDPKISAARDGRIRVNGTPTPYYVESGQLSEDSAPVWYLQRYGRAHRAFAWHKRKRDVLAAVGVFIEGVTRQPEESDAQMINRALQLCLETGSRHVINLSKDVTP